MARTERDGFGRDEEISFRALAETIPQLVWVTNSNGSLTYANRRFLDYFGITQDALSSWWLKDWLHPDDSEQATGRWKHALQTGDPYEVEYRLREASGTYHWFLARGTPVHDPRGQVIGWCGTSTPIDRQRLTIERQRRMVETFAAAFVPQPLPAIRGLELDAMYVPADEEARVGGDWYDVLELDGGDILITMGDVTGHGLGAALSMAKLRQAIVACAIDQRDPALILQRAGRIFALLDGAIATAVVAILDPAAQRIRYALAGHPSPVVATTTSAEFLPRATGIPIGVDADARYETQELALSERELLVFYTDGLIEARRAIEPDEALLLAAARDAATGRGDARRICEVVLGDTPNPDDVAILTVRAVRGAPVGPA
jgi:PAS domain S-box-containing protein